MAKKHNPVRIEFRPAPQTIEETPTGSAIILKRLIERLGLTDIANDLAIAKHHGVCIEDIMLVILLFASYGVRSVAQLQQKAKRDKALAAVIDDVGKINEKMLLYFEGRNEPGKLEKLLTRFVASGQQNKRFRSKRKGILAVDDTSLVKTGKHMERIEVIFDHATGQYVLGYVIVTITYADAAKAYPVNFEFRLTSEEERREAQRQKERKKAGIDLRKKGSLLHEVALELENGLIPECVEVTGVNLDAPTLSKLDEETIQWLGIPNGRTALFDSKANRWKLDVLHAATMRNKPLTLELDGWHVHRKAVRLQGYGEVDFTIVNDMAGNELGSFLLRCQSDPEVKIEILQRYFQARQPADSNKLKIALRGFTRAKDADIRAETAAGDGWYFVPWFVSALLQIPGIARFVSRLKSNCEVCYKGEWMQAKQLWERLNFRAVRDRTLRVASVTVQIKGLSMPVKLVFLQELDKCFRIKARYILVCTDLKWSWKRILGAYKLRWTIEVFFRMAKQKYGLQSFHVRKFTEIFCHVTFSFLSYLLCAHLRICDPRLHSLTMGEVIDRYLSSVITLRPRASCLTVYLDPAFVKAFGLPFDTS